MKFRKAVKIDRKLLNRRILKLLLLVSFSVEVAEEVDKDYHIGNEEVSERLRQLTVHHKDHHQIAKHKGELCLVERIDMDYKNLNSI